MPHTVLTRWTGSELVNYHHVLYLLKLIRCGRPSCHHDWHGPYLYRRVWKKKDGKWKTVEEYIGKQGSAAHLKILKEMNEQGRITDDPHPTH